MAASRPGLTIVRRIKSTPDKVYAALTEPGKMVRWWGPDAGPTLSAEADVRPGGRFSVAFRTLDGEEHESQNGASDEAVTTAIVSTEDTVADTAPSHIAASRRPS